MVVFVVSRFDSLGRDSRFVGEGEGRDEGDTNERKGSSGNLLIDIPWHTRDMSFGVVPLPDRLRRYNDHGSCHHLHVSTVIYWLFGT